MEIKVANRSLWKFQYTVAELLKATSDKVDHHTNRLKWWSDKRNQVIEEIKNKGLEIDDSLVADTSFTSNYARQPQIMIKDKYARDLSEANQKITEHSNKIKDYAGWVEVLSSQSSTKAYELHQDDWLYFFGK